VSDERRGRLVLVATPIGNLGDLSPRAREVLATADLICCEDTRRTRALLSASGITAKGPHGDRLLSLHGHNEATRLDRVVAAVASGSTADRFCVEGFLPRKGPERRRRLESLLADHRTSVVLEAPGRLVATLQELAAADPARPMAVVRELTKLHEEVWRGTLSDAAEAFAARDVRGEIVLVIGGAPPAAPAGDAAVEAAVRAALDDDPSAGPRQVAELVAASLKVPRRRAYEAALRLRGAVARDGGTSGPG